MSTEFRFKQFSVFHDRCIMKVGTDGVLLGASAEVSAASEILDIGAGSGLIALMAAQRSKARITGIEIDEGSASQAAENAGISPWAKRIRILNISLQDFVSENTTLFDCILCNPPFFSAHLKSPEEGRNLARHQSELNYPELLTHVKNLIAPGGDFWLIIPASETSGCLRLAKDGGYFQFFQTDIFPKSGKPPHRNIIGLCTRQGKRMQTETLTIRTRDGLYTKEYRKVTRGFYLDF